MPGHRVGYEVKVSRFVGASGAVPSLVLAAFELFSGQRSCVF